MKRFCYSLFLLLLLGAASPVAQAQDVPVMFDGLAGNLAINDLVFDNTTGRIATPASSNARPARITTGSATALTYTSTPALRQQTVQRYAGRLRASNPAAAQAVTGTFGPGKHDYGQTYYGLTKNSGLRDNNPADALAAYLVIGWMIVNDVRDARAVTVPMAQGVRAQATPLLAANPQLRTQAAQVGEELKLQTVLMQGGWQAAIREGNLASYRQGIDALFKQQYHLNLAQYTLTSRGFSKK